MPDIPSSGGIDQPVVSQPEVPQTPPVPAEPVAPAAPAQAQPHGVVLVARYGIMGNLGEFAFDGPKVPPIGTKLVVRSERGVELATLVVVVGEGAGPCCVARGCLEGYLQACGPDHAYHRGGRVLRLANPQDLIDYRHLESSCKEESSYCRKLIKEMGLPMRLSSAEHLLGGERVIFYFTAEARVDFRELVRLLASQYRTRIEMRQVGARDEARLVGDYERCGQRCCCQGFMKALKPVSMRMAKTQKATLDPTKISGRCGRLMCCLRFEDSGYEELRRMLPRRNTFVRTESAVGKVVDTQILTQLVRLLLRDHTLVMASNEEIIERDLPMPDEFRYPMPEPPDRRRPVRAPAAHPPQRLADLAGQYDQSASPPAQEAPAQEADELDETAVQAQDAPPGDHEAQPVAAGQGQDQGQGSDRPRKRRRRSRRGRGQPQRANQPGGGNGASAGSGHPSLATPPPAQGSPDGARKRRRRKRKGGWGNAPTGQTPPAQS